MTSRKKRSKKAGLPPGSLVYIGEREAEEVRITLVEYGDDHYRESTILNPEDCRNSKDESSIKWVRVEGIHNVEVLEKLGECFNLHPLTLEDILNTDQRPKMEDFEHYLYIVMKMLSIDEKVGLAVEQVSLILGPNMVISFQEGRTAIFRPLIERLGSGKGRLRKMGADYLVYGLIDAIVDNYFLILESMAERIESLEEEIAVNPGPESMQSIQRLRREMALLRRAVWPLGEVANGIVLSDSQLIGEPSKLYFKDVYDHIIHATDTIESFREMLTEMFTIYLSSVSNRLNEVMKMLTLIATIFMPLTFIAGIYGMNFQHMPELHWPWGYPLVMLLMLLVAVCMLAYFRKRDLL